MSEVSYAFTALVDVLGYRYRLDSDRRNGSLAFKDSLQAALQSLSTINESVCSYQAISDTIILSCPHREMFVDFLGMLKSVQIAFLKQGLFVRGGIAFAPHFKSNTVTYSHAVALAYELESKVAIYPRLVVDHNIIEMLRESNEIESLIQTELIAVSNGVHFLNIIDQNNWSMLWGFAGDLYSRERQFLERKEVEFAKHSWFEQYLLASAHRPQDVVRYVPGISALSF